MKWIGQSIWDQIARFRNDVYLESISTGTIASGAHLGLDSNNKIVKAVDGGGDLTSIVAGTGLSGTSLTGPIPTINIDAAQPTVTSLGTLTGLTGGTGDFIWNTNTLVVDTSEAKVGIGTSSPSELLHISSGVATHAKVLIDAGADADLILDKGAGSRRSHIDYKIAGTTKWYAGTADSDVVGDGDDYFIGTTVGGTSAEFFLKRSNGYVGIGTTSPARPLHVVNTSSQTVAIFDGGNNGAGEIAFTGAGTSGGTYVTIGAVEDDMSLSAGASERMRITSAGNVGVGVTAPASKLHVAGTVQVGVDDTGHDVKFFGATANHYMLWDESADLLQVAGDLEIKNANGSNPSDAGSLVFNESGTAWGSNMYGFRLNLEGSSNLLQFQSANTSTVSTILTMGRDNLTSTFSGPLTVGVDDTGHDVKFFGATSGSYMMWDESQNRLRLTDDAYLTLGDGDDIILFHNGSNSYLLNDTGDLYITNRANDKDIIFQSDDGSGGVETYFYLDGSASSGSPYTIFPDNSHLGFGSGYGDLQLHHNGTNSYIKNRSTGDLYIMNEADDKDIIFQSDDGAGGNATYFKLDGSLATHDGSSTLTMYTKWDDNSIISLGTGNDIRLYHNGTNSYLDNLSGDYYIRQKANDKDLILECDDGSGGNTAYLTLDGGLGYMVAKKGIKHEGFLWFLDNKTIYVGSGNDLRIHHNGSDSYISQEGTGSLIIRTTTNDEDVIFQCDDGSGGTATYLTLDGSAATVEVAKEMNLAVPLATDQQKHVMHYDFQGYASGDGTNYEMANNLSDTNAPFEHNISLGADGTTATTVQNIIRSGGKVMPRACTLTRWTGWAAAAGSATAYVALFKVTPTRNSNTDLSAVLLDEFSYTALGNAKMEDFDETSFTATAIAAGDVLITAMKSESGAVHYFTSTVEVEF